jgi:hypothetical protein
MPKKAVEWSIKLDKFRHRAPLKIGYVSSIH